MAFIQCIKSYVLISEQRERSKRSEANNRGLFEIPRYLYIYIYIHIYILCYLKWARSALRELWLKVWGSSC